MDTTREGSLIACLRHLYSGLNRAAFSGLLPDPAPVVISPTATGIRFNPNRKMIEVDPGTVGKLDEWDVVNALHVACFEYWCDKGEADIMEPEKYRLHYIPGILHATCLQLQDLTKAVLML